LTSVLVGCNKVAVDRVSKEGWYCGRCGDCCGCCYWWGGWCCGCQYCARGELSDEPVESMNVVALCGWAYESWKGQVNVRAG